MDKQKATKNEPNILNLIDNYVRCESKYGGYTSIVELLKWLRENFKLTKKDAEFKLLNFIYANKGRVGLQEASSNKEIGLIIEEGSPELYYIKKNYLFIRFLIQ